jgi:serine/threonine-protein kinase
MSPEQAYGDEVDHRSDIFSYGVLLHQLATLHLPFHGSNVLAVLQEVYTKQSPRIADTRTDLPDAFQWMLDKAMEKDRNHRYQLMEELLHDFRAVGGSKISVRVITRIPEQSPTLTIATQLPTRLRRQQRTRRAMLAGGVAAMAALIAGGALWYQAGRLTAERHVAVLPFANIGGDRETQALCDGLVETLTASLGQLQRFRDALWVVPSSEVRQQPVANAAAAHQVFGATLVVTGSLQKNGDRLRLIASLVDAVNRKQIASRTIDTSVSNITEIQDTMASRVAEMLELNLDPEMRRTLGAGRTTIPGAYEAYAKGLGYLRGGRAEDFGLAAGLFELGVQKDPTYALAYAALGEADTGRYAFSRDQQFLEKARAACQRALELNPDLPEGRLAMAQLDRRTGKFDEAVKELERLMAVDRTRADAYYTLAETYNDMGRVQDAEATYKKAILLRPGYWAGYNALGRFYAQHGQYDAAEQNLRMATSLTPDNALAYSNLGGLYNKWGHYEEAIAALQKSLALRPTGAGYSNLGTIYYFLGRYDEAVPMMAKAVELVPNRYVIWGNYGDACRWSTNSRDKAEAAYRKAIELCQAELRVRPTDSLILASEALYHAKIGETGPALAGIAKALQQKQVDTAVHFKAGIVYELAGQRDRALAELEAALKAGYSAEEINKERELERLRSDARFATLIERRSSGAKSR